MTNFPKVSLISICIVAIFLLGISVGALKADMWNTEKNIAAISWNARPENYEEQKQQKQLAEKIAYWTSTESPLTLLATSSVTIAKSRIANPITFVEMKDRSGSTSTAECAVFDETRMREHSAMLQPYTAIEYTLTFASLPEQKMPLQFFITLVPNTPNYQTLADVQLDFGLCEAGGKTYPARLSPQKKWVVLRSSCGSGMVDSEKEQGQVTSFCDGYIKEAMESLEFHE